MQILSSLQHAVMILSLAHRHPCPPSGERLVASVMPDIHDSAYMYMVHV